LRQFAISRALANNDHHRANYVDFDRVCASDLRRYLWGLSGTYQEISGAHNEVSGLPDVLSSEVAHLSDDKISISISIDADQLRRASECLGLTGNDPKDQLDGCAKLAQFTLSEFLEWTAGGRRYTSLSDMYMNWVEAIYELGRLDDHPSVDHLYNNLNIPYGLAAYICRVLADKNVAKWRQQDWIDLRRYITNAKQQCEQFTHDQEPLTDKKFSANLGRGAVRQLRTVSDRLRKSNPDFLIPEVKRGFGETDVVSVACLAVQPLLDYIDNNRLGLA